MFWRKNNLIFIINIIIILNFVTQKMSEQQAMVAPRAPKYPNSFLFGSSCGFVVSVMSRYYLTEPLCARPISYFKTMFAFGFVMFQWDYFRRNCLEQVLEGEERMKYYTTM